MSFAFKLMLYASLSFSVAVQGQTAQSHTSNRIQGNIDINVQSDNATAISAGTNSLAKNTIGIVENAHKGNTNVSVAVRNVTTVSSGNKRKACTTIGGVTNGECK